jgi:galactoside O-acetyltransferase
MKSPHYSLLLTKATVNDRHLSVFLKPDVIYVADTARLDAFLKIEGGEGVEIGRNVHVASFSHLNLGGGRLILEDGVGISSHVRIVTGTNVPGHGRSSSICSPDAVVSRGKVIVRKNAILFTGATILPDVEIGENAVIGANCLIRKSVGPYEVWVGNPAQMIKVLQPENVAEQIAELGPISMAAFKGAGLGVR